jgi:hypothetical protein
MRRALAGLALLFSLAAPASLACGATTSDANPGAGAAGTVTGTVVVAPCRPVERAGDPPCPPRAGVEVDFAGPVSRAVKTDAGGVYQVSVPAGSYTVTVRAGIRPQPTSVTVAAGQLVTLNLSIDSGIR